MSVESAQPSDLVGPAFLPAARVNKNVRTTC